MLPVRVQSVGYLPVGLIRNDASAPAYGALAGPVSFSTDQLQTIRIQTREDGVSLDQIVLSPGAYLTTAPGATRNDTTIMARTQ